MCLIVKRLVEVKCNAMKRNDRSKGYNIWKRYKALGLPYSIPRTSRWRIAQRNLVQPEDGGQFEDDEDSEVYSEVVSQDEVKRAQRYKKIVFLHNFIFRSHYMTS